jgi:hypothetical protein
MAWLKAHGHYFLCLKTYTCSISCNKKKMWGKKSGSLHLTMRTCPISVHWDLSRDILKEDTCPGKNSGEIIPLGIKSVYKGTYLSPGWTPVLKEHLARCTPCLKGCSNIYA